MYHRLFPVWDPGEGDGDGDGDGDGAGGDDGEGQGKGKRCVFLLSGQDSGEPFRLDTMFFQNWYGYQDEVVMRGGGMDLIQVMCVSFPLFEPADFFFVVADLFEGMIIVVRALKLMPNCTKMFTLSGEHKHWRPITPLEPI